MRIHDDLSIVYRIITRMPRPLTITVDFDGTCVYQSYPTIGADADAALGCPLLLDLQQSERPFVDWIAMRKLLMNVVTIARNGSEMV